MADNYDIHKEIFGSESKIPLQLFKELFKTALNARDDEVQEFLPYVIDDENEEEASASKFRAFCDCFYPLGPDMTPHPSERVFTIVEILRMPWFHGRISHEEAEKRLRDKPKGTFLIRFSSNRPATFVAAAVGVDGTIQQALIQFDKDDYYKPLWDGHRQYYALVNFVGYNKRVGWNGLFYLTEACPKPRTEDALMTESKS
jgi:hypothetical protein